MVNAAGLLQSMDVTDARIVTVTDDWSTIRTVRIMRSLPPRQRRRILQVIELLADENSEMVRRDVASRLTLGNSCSSVES